MKIVGIGGTRLIESKTVARLRQQGHELDNLYVADANFFPSIGA